MTNRFEQVDEIQEDAITVALVQRNDGQWGTVHVPNIEGDKPRPAMATTDIPPRDAVLGAIKLANDVKLAIVVMDRDNIWKAEWGTLYRWEDEPDATEDPENPSGPAPDGGATAGP